MKGGVKRSQEEPLTSAQLDAVATGDGPEHTRWCMHALVCASVSREKQRKGIGERTRWGPRCCVYQARSSESSPAINGRRRSRLEKAQPSKTNRADGRTGGRPLTAGSSRESWGDLSTLESLPSECKETGGVCSRESLGVTEKKGTLETDPVHAPPLFRQSPVPPCGHSGCFRFYSEP